jgi:phenylalanine N-monooxygenase
MEPPLVSHQSPATTLWHSLIIILLFTPLIIKLLFKQKNTHKSTKLALPPGPTPWPIVGNIPEMLANRPTFKWIQKIMTDLNTEVMCIRLGNIPVIFVSSPEIAREFFIKQDSIFASRPIYWTNEYVTGGYLSATLSPYGEQWKKIKKLISNELVSPLRLKWLQDKRVEEADNLVRCIYNKCVKSGGKGLVNVRIAAQHYAGNVIRRLILNLRHFGNGSEEIGEPGLEEVEYVEALFIVLQHLFAYSVTDYMPCLRGLDLDGHERILKNACQTARKYHDPIIEDRIQMWKYGKKKNKEDLLDVLISLKDAHNNALLSKQEIKSIVMVCILVSFPFHFS